jgi:GR25 family glycosyltransferase involved in LPS biosynthesis
MKLNKKLLNYLFYSLVFSIVFALLYYVYTLLYKPSVKPVPILTDVYVINLDSSKDRWAAIKSQVGYLAPLPVHRWSATDGRKMTEADMIRENIPKNMFPETIEEPHLKQRRKGEIGCYLSHKKLLQHLSTLDVDDNAGHLILEDDVVINSNTLDVWRKKLPYLNSFDPNWGMFYFGTNGNVKITNETYGIGKLESGWGTHAYVVRHSYVKTILNLIDTMTDAIDIMYQDNYETLHTYVLKNHTINPRQNVKSTIWHDTN